MLASTDAPVGAGGQVEALLSKFQLTVYTIAMHLLSDPRLAEAVVESVFLHLSKLEALPNDEQALEKLVHATAYDYALAELVRVKKASKAH